MEIGANLSRAWLRQVATLLASRPRRQTLLFGEASAKWSQLFNLSRQAAGLSKASPHQLRHGGASMDAVDQHTDLSIMARGNWKSPGAVQIYRRTGRYLRLVNSLSPKQLNDAALAPTTIVELLRAALL